MSSTNLIVQKVNSELQKQFEDKETVRTLLTTTFKGMSEMTMRKAILEGMIRGFEFKDFLNKDVYAISFGNDYSLVTSIDYTRKVAAQNGLVGKSAPVYGMDNGDMTCSITVKRQVNGIVGEYTSLVYLSEYTTKKNQWVQRPRTMLAKCFSKNTEVLTEKGFLKFSDITTEKIMQVTQKNGLEAVKSTPFMRIWDGDMISYDKTDIDFRVTSNHEMVTTTGRVEAGKIFDESRTRSVHKIKKTMSFNKKEYNISDNELKLIGAVIADGNINNNKNIRIDVSREKKINFLRQLDYLRINKVKAKSNVGFISGRKITTKSDKISFNFSYSENIKKFLNPKKDIFINEFIKLSQRQARIVIDTWIFFDGNVSNSGTKRIYTSNISHVKSLEVMAVYSGYSLGKGKVRKNTGTKNNYVFVLSDISAIPLFRVPNNKKTLTKENVKNEEVWCVTVPSSTIIVRKNNFSFVCGNCAEMHALRMAFPEELSKSYIEDESVQKTVVQEEEINLLSISNTFENAKTVEELNDAFRALSVREKANKEVVLLAKERKQSILDYAKAKDAEVEIPDNSSDGAEK